LKVKYPIGEISKLLKAKWLQKGQPVEVSHLLVDSRKLVYPESSLFVPLITSQRNGHDFIGELYRRGVRAFLVSEVPARLDAYPEANFLEVADTLKGFQTLVACHRKKFSIPVIGITGSNGKTIVKEWLYQLLAPDYHIVRSPKSYNSQTGVPLSVWQMNSEHTLAIFEAGISRPGEMTNLEKIIQPTAGIFTNIGDAHNEGFLNILQKIREKLALFTGAQVLVYCKDYPELHECVLQFHGLMRRKERSEEKPLKLFTWSHKTEADLKITAVQQASDQENRESEEDKSGFTRIEALYHGQPTFIRIPFADRGSIENAIHCWCMLLYFGLDEAVIRERMAQLSRVAMRLELKAAINDCSLINDSYNSDLGSLSIALDFLAQQKQHPHHTLVLSDMLQSGRSDAALYEEVAGLLGQKGVTRLIGIGKNISREKNAFLKVDALSSSFFPSTEAFIDKFLSRGNGSPALSFQDETILLKGARVFQFERISRLLEQKTHQTVLEIDLNALAQNLKVYRETIGPQVKIMVMVKAFSYGSGSFEIANLLQFHQVDYLAVAYADEGVALRQRGITLPIMVMNPEPGTFSAIIQWNLEPEVYSLRVLDLFEEELRQLHSAEAYPIHIKLDTGMHRLGFSAADLPALLRRLKGNPGLRVASVFSHLAASGDPAMDEFTGEQARRFSSMSDEIHRGLGYPFLRHLANTAATSRFAEFRYDMVRLGIGLYGVDEGGGPQPLQVVSTLKTAVAQLRQVSPGETIGYDRAGKVDEEKTIATVCIGYADGYLRSLGEGRGKMAIHGVLAPVIGKVCMDMLMLDVTGIPGVREGDPVIVFGSHPTLSEVARWAGTIPYEIMAGISGRVKRIYLQE
jgi:alanine racemase